MRGFFKLIIWLMIVGVVAVIAVVAYLAYCAQSQGSMSDTKAVMIERGIGSKGIAKTLESEGVIPSALAFRIWAIMQGKHAKFQAGEYEFDAFISPQVVIDKLASGDVVDHKITIPEGKTSAEIVAILVAEPLLAGVITQRPKEGSLLPETYHITRGESRQAVLNRMAAAHDKVVKELWPTRQNDLPFSTLSEALVLASIVEKETGKPSERRRVAAVYSNRLRIGMMLQADPTVSYGLHGGQSGVRSLTYADLRKDTPYNTYTRTGLPPTPICNSGKASIAAVLDPISSKEIYFVATGDGGHRFAETHNGHLRNVAEYRKWQKSQR